MASRRFRPLTAADVGRLPEPCVRCTFWEAGLTDLAAPPDHREEGRAKRDWAAAVTDRWGYCGVLAVQEEEVLGYLTMAPPVHVPRLAAFATTPVSSDAAVVMAVHVDPAHRGHGIGRQLVQTAAGLVARRDIRALEAVGTHRSGPGCLLPAAWLERVGFTVVRPHLTTPRLRMDLHAGVRWLPELSAAWGRLTDLVVQPHTPEPLRPRAVRSASA